MIISNRSLVLQKVGRSEGGVHTCTAHNSEGDGVSNSMSLDVKCKFNRTTTLRHTNTYVRILDFLYIDRASKIEITLTYKMQTYLF